MNKAISLVLGEKDILELIQILLDKDAESALAFLKTHFNGKEHDLLEGG